MKEVYLDISTDSSGNFVDKNVQKVLSQFPNNQASALLRSANGRKIIRCLLLSSGNGLAVTISD